MNSLLCVSLHADFTTINNSRSHTTRSKDMAHVLFNSNLLFVLKLKLSLSFRLSTGHISHHHSSTASYSSVDTYKLLILSSERRRFVWPVSIRWTIILYNFTTIQQGKRPKESEIPNTQRISNVSSVVRHQVPIRRVII